MVQQNKRTPANRATSKSKKTQTRRRAKKGSKVYIPASKIIVLCTAVVISCSALLFVTTMLDQKQKKTLQKIEKIEDTKQIAKNKAIPPKENQRENRTKKDDKKVDAEWMQQPLKNEPSKASQTAKTSDAAQSPSHSSDVKPSSHSSSVSKSSVSNQTNSPQKSEVAKSTNAVSENKEKVIPQETLSLQTERIEKREKTEIALKPIEKRPLPEKKDVQERAVDIPEIPVARPGAKLIVIFDDGGQNLQQLEKCLALPFPVTIAILPKLSYSKAAADKTRAAGKDVMLHQPMQAIARSDGTVPNPGEGALKPDMSLYEIERVVRENIAEIGPVVGLNNHEGSAICEDESRIGAVLTVANDSGIFFLDSRTTSQTRVPQAAMSMGYSYYERNVFLDNTKNRADIIAEIMRGVSIANKTGAAIMIGHVWSADVLPPILAELYPLLRAKGYEFTTVQKSGALITP
ncbi:MAG: divergent polysaccharide deacetylase family protein [Treponema sp.]|nr:divergent polysaccharide deacetylase family protein [Treponema sp.]